MASFVQYPADHPFPIQNLPYGVFSTDGVASTRPGVAIGDFILDLDAVSRSEWFVDAGVEAEVFQKGTLDPLVASSPESWPLVRAFITRLLSPTSPLKANARAYLVPRETATMHLPITIGDYTDYYASYEHAYNCGVLIRGPENAIQPNWKHLPVAYHGRASSVVVSGTPFHRPTGQILDKVGDKQPIFAPCRRLDYELELAFIYGGAPTKLGSRLSPSEARKHIFGYTLMNDWSARDIQTWEYVPLGPFLSKNFCTTISPWIVSPEALEPFKTKQYDHDPKLLPYLDDPEGFGFDVPLTIEIKTPESGAYAHVSTSNTQHTYYTFAQMLAHHSATGCPLRPSDMLGSGTLSAPRPDGLGSLLERSKMGREPFELDASRKDMTFLRDGDSVKFSAVVKAPGGWSVGFGECEGTVLPAVPFEG
ncbi:Fumarylacetoacetase [Vanrija pseudolonga]|uniref:Fumarylacetoacetase n=1 Tax=Vanrija pseudolonga TaxID=143232 RepID=A0AAF0Y5K1_9TREE|nr:Fumarylacetoacetase [Vanrija pseudolonga]